MEKRSFLNSLGWNAAMSVLAVLVIGQNAWVTLTDYPTGLLNLVVWLVIGFHFFRVTSLLLKERRR